MVKIKVFLPMHIFLMTVIVAGDSWIWLDVILFGRNQLNLLAWILLGVFAVVCPIYVIVWSSLTLCDTIVFDEHGVSRKRFGKTIRFFDWKSVKDIFCNSDDILFGWIYISVAEQSDKNLFLTLSKMRKDKSIIYFHQSKKAKEALHKYAPEFLHKKENSEQLVIRKWNDFYR